VKIAVIIPTLNEERALPDTLRHTTGLGFDDILVVDGGSADRTKAIAASHDVRCVTSRPGRARQMNAAASHSQAEVLLFLHADTLLPPTARQDIDRALADPECVGGRFDVRFEHDAGLAWLIARLINLRSRWSGIATGDQALFVRREIFERLGGFADIPIMEDVDFSRRLKHAGRTASLRTLVVTSYRRWERSGAFRTIVLMWTLRFLYWIGIHPNRLKNLYASVR
jgi:rSAM/selenodomain-associated transferase 2